MVREKCAGRPRVFCHADLLSNPLSFSPVGPFGLCQPSIPSTGRSGWVFKSVFWLNALLAWIQKYPRPAGLLFMYQCWPIFAISITVIGRDGCEPHRHVLIDILALVVGMYSSAPTAQIARRGAGRMAGGWWWEVGIEVVIEALYLNSKHGSGDIGFS